MTKAAASTGRRPHQRFFVAVVPVLAAAALAIGVLVLLGWMFGIEPLRLLTPFSDQPRVKVNTGFCIAAAAVSVLLLRSAPVSRRRLRAARALAGLVCLVAAATLFEHATGTDLGIDQLLVEEAAETALRTPYPGRMALNTTLAFLLIGSALLLFDRRWRGWRPANLLAGGAAGLALLALDGILLGVKGVALFSQYANMAFATALAFVLLALAIVGARDDSATMRILTGTGAASLLARRLLPAILIVPILLAALRLEGQRRGYFGLEFGTWILAVGLSVVFGGVVWRLIRTLDRAEARSRESERQAAQARQAAERANAAKSEFISRMSHELRTPLNSILGFSQLMQMDGLRDDQTEHVGQVVRSGQHLLALINEILDMSRIEAGKLTISSEPIGVDDAMTDAVDSIGPVAADRGVLVTIGERAPDLFVLGDRQRLKQVLLNLLSNAIKYGEGRVLVGAEAVEGRVLIRVTDNGGQIPPDQLTALFAPFERLAADSGEEEGTGLGLSLTRHLVGLMNGTVGAESDPIGGTTFTVSLPAAEAPIARDAEGPEPEFFWSAVPGSLRILHIEDNPANRSLVEAILTRRGIEVLEAPTGGDGIARAGAERPDLVLLDLHLPDMSGLDVLRELRASPETQGIPVVVLTADATSATRRRVERLGADACLAKPMDVEQLLRTLDELVVHV